MPARCVHVVVTGRVQGVGFRAWTEREALKRNLSGWVCNRRNGAVEAVFSGDMEAVETMLVAVHDGPRGARVDSVLVSEDAERHSGPFTVRATY